MKRLVSHTDAAAVARVWWDMESCCAHSQDEVRSVSRPLCQIHVFIFMAAFTEAK